MYQQTWRVVATDDKGNDEIVYVGPDHEMALYRKGKVERCGRVYMSVVVIDYEPSADLHMDCS